MYFSRVYYLMKRPKLITWFSFRFKTPTLFSCDYFSLLTNQSSISSTTILYSGLSYLYSAIHFYKIYWSYIGIYLKVMHVFKKKVRVPPLMIGHHIINIWIFFEQKLSLLLFFWTNLYFYTFLILFWNRY